jgi:hypothetical protein
MISSAFNLARLSRIEEALRIAPGQATSAARRIRSMSSVVSLTFNCRSRLPLSLLSLGMGSTMAVAISDCNAIIEYPCCRLRVYATMLTLREVAQRCKRELRQILPPDSPHKEAPHGSSMYLLRQDH